MTKKKQSKAYTPTTVLPSFKDFLNKWNENTTEKDTGNWIRYSTPISGH